MMQTPAMRRGLEYAYSQDVLGDVYASKSWERFEKFKAHVTRNADDDEDFIVLALRASTDGVGLHHTRTKSFYHLAIAFLNLPPWVRNKWSAILPCLLLSPKASRFFQLALAVPLEELLQLQEGVRVLVRNDDGSTKVVKVYAMLLSTMCDAKAEPLFSMR